MRRMKWAVALVTALALLGGACGNNAEQVLAAVGDRTADAGSSRMAMTVTAVADGPVDSEESAPQNLELKAEGLIDYETGHGLLTMDMGSLGIPGAPQGDAEMRMLGPVVYMRLPGNELGNRPWIKFDLDALNAGGSAPVPGLNPTSNDPRGVLDALRGVGGDVEEVGREDVRGVPTTHYRASVDLKKAQEAVPEERREDFAAFSRQLGIDSLPIDVWVDEEGRARRFAYKVDTPASGQTPASAVELLIDLYDFGVEVDVEAPPDSEVTEYGELDPAA